MPPKRGMPARQLEEVVEVAPHHLRAEDAVGGRAFGERPVEVAAIVLALHVGLRSALWSMLASCGSSRITSGLRSPQKYSRGRRGSAGLLELLEVLTRVSGDAGGEQRLAQQRAAAARRRAHQVAARRLRRTLLAGAPLLAMRPSTGSVAESWSGSLISAPGRRYRVAMQQRVVGHAPSSGLRRSRRSLEHTGVAGSAGEVVGLVGVEHEVVELLEGDRSLGPAVPQQQLLARASRRSWRAPAARGRRSGGCT